jgi:tRNA pseudouridine38-40 synthase
VPRFKLTLEYDGRPFVGWQRQANGMSVQQALEEALARIDSPARVNGAGRTDAGVHATAQVAHVDLVKPWTGDKLREAMNAHLRRWPVVVLLAEAAPDDFDARFSATRRRYVYRILARRAPPSFARGLVWHVARRLDAGAMHAAAQRLIGRHDFTTFRAAECQANSPVRTLERLDVTRNGETIEIVAAARSFLHHQVRSLVGSLEHVGSGKWSADDLEDALHARERARCGQVAPPDGLYLVGVDYGDGAPT